MCHTNNYVYSYQILSVIMIYNDLDLTLLQNKMVNFDETIAYTITWEYGLFDCENITNF